MKRWVVILLLILTSTAVDAQKLDERRVVDTLTMKERIALRTNAIDWALMLPNIGVEYDVRGTNWNRWTVGLSLRGNWQTSHTYKPGIVYNLFGFKAEVRNYYRLRQLSSRVKPQTAFLDKLFSVRRENINHPLTTYYKGGYLSYTTYSLKFGTEGKQGSAITLGFSLGMVKPLYTFPNGNSIDLDLGAAAGLAYAKTDTYILDRESNCYPVTEVGKWSLVPHPVLSELRASFVYRFGNYPITKKYRFRYDVDLTFMARQDSIKDARAKERMERLYADSVGKVVREAFFHIYDSIAKINQQKADSISRAKSMQDKEAAAKVKAAAAAAKLAAKAASKATADSIKAAQKAGADSIKAAKKAPVKEAETIVPADSAAVDTTTAVTPPVEQPSEEQQQPAEEQPAAEQPAEEQPAAEQPAEEQPAAEQPAAEQPAAEQPAEEQPAAEQPAEEQPAAEQPAEEQQQPAAAAEEGKEGEQ